jgi:epsin
MSYIPSLTDLKDTFINTVSRNKEILTGVVTGASETTRLVITATNNEQWGPTGPQMRTVSDLTFNYSDCTQVMEAVWERLETDITSGANWRNIYKTLLLLDYIIRNGSERVVNEARQNSYQIKSLSAVHFVDSDGIDRGLSIRERAKHVVELLGDTARLREERKKCKQNRDKYSTAYGNESYERPYNRHSNTTFEEEDFSSRRTNSHKVSFNNLTDADFKDDDDYGTSSGKNQQPDDDEFASFPAPTRQPKLNPPAPSNPPKQNPVNYPPATTQTAQPVAWDPFSQAPTPSTNDNWEDFNPRGAPTQSPNLFEPISAVITPTPVNPVGPSIPNNPPSNGSNTLPPNLFNPLPSNSPSGSNNPPSLKLNQVTPSITPKSNDPWANSHLFNLSNNPSSPRSTNSVNSGTAKPLGATVGTGWPNATSGTTPATTTVPTVTYAYPPNVAYTGAYTYPVATNPPTLYTTTPVNYSNTSWRV